MRIAFISDHFLFPTGYGVYTRNLMEQLRERKHTCVELALQWSGAPMENNGFIVYPGSNQALVERALDLAKPDVLIHVRDNWVFCVPPGTLIPGDNKAIEEYHVGDRTTYGGLVTNVMQRPFSGELVSVKAKGLLPLSLTGEHPVLAVRVGRPWREGVRSGPRTFGTPHFIEAKNLSAADALLVPRLRGRITDTGLDLRPYTNQHGYQIGNAKGVSFEFPLTPETAWVLGLYAADGSGDGRRPVFSLGKTAKDTVTRRRLVATFRRLGYTVDEYDHETYGSRSWVVGVYSRLLHRAFQDWCGHGSHGKQVPDFILEHENVEIPRAFLEGYLAGDGYEHDPGHWQASTVSRALAIGIQLIGARLGYKTTLNEYARDGTFRSSHGFNINILTNGRARTDSLHFSEDYVVHPIYSIQRTPYVGSVYNLTTEGGTFLVSGAITHNCPRFFNPAYHFWGLCKARDIAFVAATPIQSFPVPVELAQTVSTEADLTLVQAECQRKALVDMGAPPDRVNVLFHGVDTSIFHPGPGDRTPLGVPAKGPMLLTVGTNTERKNLPGTLLTLSKLPPRYPEAFLYLHTAPTGFYALDCHTRALGLSGKGKVWLPPDRGNPQVAIWAEEPEAFGNVYRAADVFLSTTFAEGFGAPTLEAIASGLPVVITDTPIHRELWGEFSHVSFIPAEKALPTPWGYDWFPDTSAAADLVASALAKGKPKSISVPPKYRWPNIAERLEKMLEPLVRR